MASRSSLSRSKTVTPTRPGWLVQFGRRLLLARGRAGLTQEELGAPDLSKSFISLLESGRSHPSVETVVALAKRLNTSVGALLLDPAELRLATALNLLHLASQLDPVTDSHDSLRLVEAAAMVLPEMPPALRLRAALLRSRAVIAEGRFEEAERLTDEAVTLARRHKRSTELGMALALRGEIEVRRQAFAAALPFLEEATATLQRAKAARTEESIRALISLGATRAHLGQIDRAQRAYRRALELATRLRLQGLRGRALVGLGLVAWTRRQMDAAAAALGEAREAFDAANDPAEAARTLGHLGHVLREHGRPEEALRALEQALEVLERVGDPTTSRDGSGIRNEIALVHLAQERHAEAARSARQAVRDAQAGGDPAREAMAQVTLARVLRAQRRRADAIELLRGAVAALTRLDLEAQAATAAGELGLLLREAGDDAEAAKYLSMALRPSRQEAAAAPEPSLSDLPS